MELNILPSQQLHFDLNDDGQNIEIISKERLPLDTWTHVGFTYNKDLNLVE